MYAGGLEYVVRTTPLAAQESTGAGDAFCAGFLAGYVHKYPLSQCARLGNRAAALTLDSCGVQTDEQKAALFLRLLSLQG
ncbi:hypothetical protein FACS1894200_12370 [Spirochaetia bacterium]|nr:hypothetical protein FACS1894200_12370 [Spirochaetia bacterium]